jgi:RNA polymerase sigma-70 factor (ECF subfamily)
VLQARKNGEGAHQALEELCQIYWFPLYAWCRHRSLSTADAEDMVQGFFLKVLEKRMFDAADASLGKLRTFLLTGLQRHVKDELNKASALRRGGGKVVSFDSAQAEEWYTSEILHGESSEHLYDRQWALTLLVNAMHQLEKQAADKGKSAHFVAMKPFLTDEGSAEAYQQAAASLSMKADSFKVAVHRLRAKFKLALRKEVSGIQFDQSSVDEEITYLWKVLGGA